MSKPRIAILGAGPIGLETALYAARRADTADRDWQIDIYERDVPGAHLLQWGHVEFFSPWRLNRSPWGEAALKKAGVPLDDPQAFPTGREFVERYLQPLAGLPLLEDALHTGCEVLGLARRDALKGEHIGARGDQAGPFLLHLRERRPDGSGTERSVERYTEADVVIDTTGVYDQPNGLGPGGLQALGEASHRAAIDYWIPDPRGDDRPDYADRRTLVVGGGYSAVTTLRALLDLREDAPDTDIHWLLRDDAPPYAIIEDDPLPARRALGQFGNDAAAGRIDGIQPHFGVIERIADGNPLRVTLAERRRSEDSLPDRPRSEGSSPRALDVNRIVANVGYRPRVDLFRELQVHQCYATEGPMDLAASLLAAGSDSADCLDQSAGGADTLTTPEGDFFVLGAKSYGRNSNFLLKVGHEQIITAVNRIS